MRTEMWSPAKCLWAIAAFTAVMALTFSLPAIVRVAT